MMRSGRELPLVVRAAEMEGGAGSAMSSGNVPRSQAMKLGWARWWPYYVMMAPGLLFFVVWHYVPIWEAKMAFEQVRIGYCGVDHGRVERELKPEELIVGANMAYNLERTAGLKFDPRRGRKAGFQAGGDDLDFLSRARERGPLVWSPDMRVKHYVDPNRLTLAYVRKFFRDNGRCIADADGIPGGGRTLFGVPTWLLEKCLKHRATAVWKRLRHGRVAALREMQTVWMREGMVLACYANRKRPAVPTGGGVPA